MVTCTRFCSSWYSGRGKKRFFWIRNILRMPLPMVSIMFRLTMASVRKRLR